MMVIGKARNPRAFKNCSSLPVEYYSTKNAWMTSGLFVKWFQESFVLQVKKFQAENNLNGKAILLVDNAPSHASEIQLTSDDGQIITMFLPPNCTPLIQPMDQNAIRLIKTYYRKSLLVHVLSLEENDITKALKNITLKDAVFLLADSWNKVLPDALQKCWRNIFSADTETATRSESEWDLDDDIPLSIIKERWDSDRQEFAEIGNMLQQINSDNYLPNEADIKNWISGDEEHLPLDNDNLGDDNLSPDEEVATDKVKHDEAIMSFNTCIQWAEENRVELCNLIILRRLRQCAMVAKQACIRQSTITDFFKP